MNHYLAVLISWWRQPDHYDWLSSYLDCQRLREPTRVLMVLVIVLLGAAPVIMNWSPSGPGGGIGGVLSVFGTTVTACLALLWITRWPTRRQSTAFALSAAACIALACLVDRDPMTGLLGCASFAPLAGYVAFFHTSGYLATVIGIAVTTTATTAGRVALAGDPALAISKSMVILVAVLAVPFAVQVVVHLLGSDAAESDLDALTGVHNRRGFYRGAIELVNRAREAGSTVGVVLVDLDGFKRINDTHGHAAGDQLLIAVSDILRRHADGDAVAARVGGEEFVIAGRFDHAETTILAERVRLDVAALPEAVTLSVGSATAHVGPVDDNALRLLLDWLVDAADDAMYDAKRAGGNQVRHSTRTATPS